MSKKGIKTILNDIATGLEQVHSTNIVYYDLKVKNVLIKDGRALLADFGIAKLGVDQTQAQRTGTSLLRTL